MRWLKKLKAQLNGERFEDWTHLLYDQAVLAEGAQLDDPAGFVKRLNGLMAQM